MRAKNILSGQPLRCHLTVATRVAIIIEVAEIHTSVGFPDAEIVELASKLGAGLIVVGSRGLGPLRRALMGSVSDSVVRHAHCPVLVVRQEKIPRGGLP